MRILETERLYLRELEQEDLAAMCRVLQDAETMYAYEHAFSDAEARAWLDNQRRRYAEEGFGLWAAVLKQSGRMIGQCGLTMQDYGGRRVPEIGYLFEKMFWHRGYATEAAIACKLYAFQVLELDEVYSIIRANNLPSQRVALRNGMALAGNMVKYYYGMEMPHLVYSVRRAGKLANTSCVPYNNDR